jgi:hypothetical protein
MGRSGNRLWPAIAWGCLLGMMSAQGWAQSGNAYFKIVVVDQQTGRGVPLVELETVHHVRYVTDSAGVVALNEPGLMDQDVFFFVRSHGYTVPKDGFGYRGTKLHLRAGGSARIPIQRVNIAERLYRITGEGIYRDSVLVGEKPPIRQALLNGQVAGQDTVEAIPYQDKIFWFWGDTSRPSYPLGNFATSGATSALPERGGLDPAIGVDLTYFVNAEGFCRGMAPLPDPGVVWIDALMTVHASDRHETLLARYERLKELGKPLERGLMRFNDSTQTFEPIARYDLSSPVTPQGHPFHDTVQGADYLYFPTPYPNLRVRATLADLEDLTRYEAYTPLAPGGSYEGVNSKIERDAHGKPKWAWKRATAPLSPSQQRELIAAGKMKVDESPFALRDLDTGKSVEAHGGSVAWNAYRRRWIMIFVQASGTSYLGEVWYAEAERPEGPWLTAKKIVTHDRYTFYNPTQHPFFDQQGGRTIYFEGTYTNQFTGAPETPPTPRYEYNQIMYRLDLADTRLHTRTAESTTGAK